MTPEEQSTMNSELFERLRKLETAVALLSQEVNNHRSEFQKHDKQEMDKFRNVEKSIAKFNKMLWVGMGIILASSDNIWTVIIKLIG